MRPTHVIKIICIIVLTVAMKYQSSQYATENPDLHQPWQNLCWSEAYEKQTIVELDHAERVRQPILNSVINHPERFDEHNFINITDLKTHSNSIWSTELQPNTDYEVQIYFRNDSDPKYYQSGGTATGVRLAIDFNTQLMKDQEGAIAATIMADNTEPAQFTDLHWLYADTNLEIQYIEHSARIHSNGKVNNTALEDELFSKTGCLLGYNRLNGRLPGGDQFMGWVSFRIHTKKVINLNTMIYDMIIITLIGVGCGFIIFSIIVMPCYRIFKHYTKNQK